MPKLRVHNFSISLDGYGAGPNQDIENPLGLGGLALNTRAVGYECTEHATTQNSMHFILRKRVG
jgi:hypothetical protein